MVRPPRKPNSRPIQFNLCLDVIDMINKYRGHMSASDFVEEAVKFVVKGQGHFMEVITENEKLRKEFKTLQQENERLKKEKENLEKKLDKLELELEKWRERWGKQKTLDKWSKKYGEIKNLVEILLPHLEEGKKWAEVMEEVGILEKSDQIDLLNKLYPHRIQNSRYEVDMLASQYLRDWVLVKNGSAGFFNFELRRLESLAKSHKRRLERFVGVSAE